MLLGLGIIARFAEKFGVSTIPLYLVAGLAFGQGGLLPLNASTEFLEVGSELGVILLLLMLGLEYTPNELLYGLKTNGRSGFLDAILNFTPGFGLALLLGWTPVAAVALGGVTWISSSGVIAKLLRDYKRTANRETPTILSLLVIEDISMAAFLPVLSGILGGVSLLQGSISVGIALLTVTAVLFFALRAGHHISRPFHQASDEVLVIGVLGLTMLVAGLAAQLSISTAVGAFLVGIALSGTVAESAQSLLSPLRDVFSAVFFVFFGLMTDPALIAPMFLPALGLALVTMGTKVLTGWLAAKRAGIGRAGRWRAGVILTPRGEFSIVIAGLAVAAGVEPTFAALATTYVLITIVVGTVASQITDTPWFRSALAPRGTQR